MKDGDKHIEYDLISKNLSGEADEREIKALEVWKSASKENQVEFDRIRKLWEEAESMNSAKPAAVDTEAAWKSLRDRIFGDEFDADWQQASDRKDGKSIEMSSPEDPQISTTSAKPKLKYLPDTRKLVWFATRIAAVLVVGFVLYALLFREQGSPPQIEILAENTITVTDLPDDTRITLNEGSRISHPKRFSDEERVVELEGEAFFEVSEDKEKPFLVQAHNAIIRVLGTSFNVRAVDSESDVSVTVEEGEVRLSDYDDIAYVDLEKNEKGILNRHTGHIEKYEKAEGTEMFWKSRTLIFRDTELSAVFKTLERLYSVELEVKNEKILSCLLTGKFQDMEADEILEKIALSFNLTIHKNNNIFEIYGEGC